MATGNSYQSLISEELYKKLPKAVLAAIAASLFMLKNEERTDNIDESIIEEWDILHKNNVIPQPAPKLSTKS